MSSPASRDSMDPRRTATGTLRRCLPVFLVLLLLVSAGLGLKTRLSHPRPAAFEQAVRDVERGQLENVNLGIRNPERDGQTLTMYFASEGNEVAVSRLLAAGADPHARDTQGRTISDWAREGGHPEMAARLLSQRLATVTHIIKIDRQGGTTYLELSGQPLGLPELESRLGRIVKTFGPKDPVWIVTQGPDVPVSDLTEVHDLVRKSGFINVSIRVPSGTSSVEDSYREIVLSDVPRYRSP